MVVENRVGVRALPGVRGPRRAEAGALFGRPRALAAEFAPKICAHAIAPSLTHTPLAATFLNSELKRAASGTRYSASEIAGLVARGLSGMRPWCSRM